MSENFQYDATFSDNILVLGQTGCGKTSFVQSLGRNKIFGSDLLSMDWVSKINLSKNREDEIRQCFSYTKVEFHYPNDVEDLNLIIKKIKKTKNTKRHITFLVKIKNLTSLLLWTMSQV